MDIKELDLNQLTMDDIDFSEAREGLEQEKRLQIEYQKKYGDKWWDQYIKDSFPNKDIDSIEETINEAIYNGHPLCITADPPQFAYEIHQKYLEKMKRLFGPFYKRHIIHKTNEPKVNKALLKDALRSGKWKELPEGLQAEYHKLAGD